MRTVPPQTNSATSEPTLAAINYLNPLLKRTSTSTQFATMIYAVVDLESAEIALTSAGHCYPILVEPSQ